MRDRTTVVDLMPPTTSEERGLKQVRPSEVRVRRGTFLVKKVAKSSAVREEGGGEKKIWRRSR